VTEKSGDATVAKANLVEHLKNIAIACDNAPLSNLEKIHRIKEEVQKAQCLQRLTYREHTAVRPGPEDRKALTPRR
jgi:hypothetical protein